MARSARSLLFCRTMVLFTESCSCLIPWRLERRQGGGKKFSERSLTCTFAMSPDLLWLGRLGRDRSDSESTCSLLGAVSSQPRVLRRVRVRVS
ncbi:hypothetical protein B0O80DRAFT_469421 [Mortierella sp. GBAus27b]|nr:hypothetical protein B0O80DRAFT_469421 [Mortierella sp. GBAus27b]